MKPILGLILLCIFNNLYASDTVTFTSSPSVGVTNYSIYYGPTNRLSTNRVHIGTNTTWTITNVVPATVAFIFATAWTNGIESIPSNEIRYTNQNFAPQNLKLSGTDALLLQTSIDLRAWKTIAIITNGSAPLLMVKQSRDMFRALSTNLPPPIPR